MVRIEVRLMLGRHADLDHLLRRHRSVREELKEVCRNAHLGFLARHVSESLSAVAGVRRGT